MSCCLLSAAVRRAPNAALLFKKTEVPVPHRNTLTTATDMGDERQRDIGGPVWVQEKEKYLSMSLEDKRKEYKCGDKYHELGDIGTWKDMVLDNPPNFPPKIAPLRDFEPDSAMNRRLSEKVSLFRGDITTLEVDAIVNAANKSLLGGGGVDGAIHSAAGPHLRAENKTHGGCQVGEVKLSGGYKLPAKYVISTVGPQGEQPEPLRRCYANAMELAVQKKLASIAFPCISTGIYGYPLLAASHVAISTVRKQLEQHGDGIDRVIFCLFTQNDEEVYQGLMQSYFPLK